MSQHKIATILKIFTVVAAIVGALFFFLYVPIVMKEAASVAEMPDLEWKGIAGISTIALMIYLALWDFWKMCTRIGDNNSFCRENARCIARIGIYALIAMALILCGTIWVATLSLLSGPLVIFVFFVEFVILGVAVVCFALSKLVENAAALKEENDLTI